MSIVPMNKAIGFLRLYRRRKWAGPTAGYALLCAMDLAPGERGWRVWLRPDGSFLAAAYTGGIHPPYVEWFADARAAQEWAERAA